MYTVKLKPNENSNATLIGYLHEQDSKEMPNRMERPCVIICPGGGYEFLSTREADPPAFYFLNQGYHVFILSYSLRDEAKNMQALADASCAIMKIREHSKEWGIIPDKIAICGFSAGGNVAACAGTLYNHPKLKEKLQLTDESNKPNAMILCYAVLLSDKNTHEGSLNYLISKEEEKQIFALDEQVTEQTPPAFLWHTFEDTTVPLENTLRFATALRKNHVSFECHIYPNGEHGQSTCNEEVNASNSHCATWLSLCTEWLGELFDFH